jgi:DNA-binding MarR family transcriptional regulator
MFAQTFLDLTHWRQQLYSADLTPTAAKVGAYLSDRVHSQLGYAWPHIKTIAAETRLAIATVKRALRELKRLGLIAIESGLGWHSSRYWCLLPSGVSSEPTVVSAATPPIEETNRYNYLPPAPAPAPETPAASLERDQEQAASTPEDSSDPDSDALQVVLALIAASGAQYPTKPRSEPLRSAQKALDAGYTVEQLKMVVAFCAATWSNPRFLTPSAVLKLSRLDERLAAAQAQTPKGQLAQCHKPFEREPEPKRADPQVVRGHLSKLKAALRGLETP